MGASVRLRVLGYPELGLSWQAAYILACACMHVVVSLAQSAPVCRSILSLLDALGTGFLLLTPRGVQKYDQHKKMGERAGLRRGCVASICRC